jgi:diaminopimelate epimerase
MENTLPFVYYQALGNDFIVIDARDDPGLVEDEQFALRLLDRHFGVGADDLIFVTRSDIADVRMRIRTPGGGWLSMCGNGIRCLARFVRDSAISRTSSLRVETDSGVRETRMLAGADDLIEVDLLQPDLRAAAIPTTLEVTGDGVLDCPLDLGELGLFRVSCVSVGNPHAVLLVDDLDAIDMTAVGPAIEQHAAFPEGVNVHAVEVLTRDRARIATWERGAGLTLA